MSLVKKECSISISATPKARTPTIHVRGLQADILATMGALSGTLVETGCCSFDDLHDILWCVEDCMNDK